MRNKIVILLDQKFVDAASADEFLRDEVGTVNVDSLSDKECDWLLEALRKLSPVRAGSSEERPRLKKQRIPGRVCPACGKKFYMPTGISVKQFLARATCSRKCGQLVRKVKEKEDDSTEARG